MRGKEVGALMEQCMKEGCTYVDGEPEELESEDERRLGLEACLQAKEIVQTTLTTAAFNSNARSEMLPLQSMEKGSNN